MARHEVSAETAAWFNPIIQIGDDVLQACEDAQVVGVEPELALAIAELSSKHAAALVALKRDVFAAGDQPKDSGTLRGATERVLADVTSSFRDPGHLRMTLVALRQHARWEDAARLALLASLSQAQRALLSWHYESARDAAETVDRIVRRLAAGAQTENGAGGAK